MAHFTKTTGDARQINMDSATGEFFCTEFVSNVHMRLGDTVDLEVITDTHRVYGAFTIDDVVNLFVNLGSNTGEYRYGGISRAVTVQEVNQDAKT
ncbi:hypothetical protein GD1_226 [Paraglaciecola Antarctic GD virus 1]|nr:hypothetical protein GD1_226 [Paraglaciecola Antarctic GD virus 1]